MITISNTDIDISNTEIDREGLRYPVSISYIRFRQIKLYALYNRYSSFNRHRTGKITVAR
jgi:hypothetical protein